MHNLVQRFASVKWVGLLLSTMLLFTFIVVNAPETSAVGTYPSQLVRLPFDTRADGKPYNISQGPQQAHCRELSSQNGWGLSHFEGDRNKGNERAIDFALPKNTPIYAAGEGTVQFEGREGDSGSAIAVRIKHDKDNLVTWYVHLNSTTVDIGQRVYPWTLIGYSGDTGSPGADHLHFAATIDKGGSPWYDAESVDIRGMPGIQWNQASGDWNSAGFSNCAAHSIQGRPDGVAHGSPHMTEASAPKPPSSSESGVPSEVGLFPNDDNPNARTQAYRDAYAEAVKNGVNPGKPVGSVHEWKRVQLQDFSGGSKGDGWGVIAWDEKHGKARYIGGGTWVAYKRAVYEKSVLGGGIDPGYPTSDEQVWAGVPIQFFEGGSWGNGAIIGGDDAWLVTGRHWEKYWDVDGWAQLGRPLGPVYKNNAGKYQQDFEKGSIFELDGDVSVDYRSSGRGGGGGGGGWRSAEIVPTVAPVPDAIAPLESAPVPAVADSMTCTNSAGIPVLTEDLRVTSENPTAGEEVYFSFTIRNDGCADFAPQLVMIAARDPHNEVSDPRQWPEIVMAPGETRTFTYTSTLDIPGQHTFWIAYMDWTNNWPKVPNTSGEVKMIYLVVSEPPSAVDAPDTDSPEDAEPTDNGIQPLDSQEPAQPDNEPGSGPPDTATEVEKPTQAETPVPLTVESESATCGGDVEVSLLEVRPNDGQDNIYTAQVSEDVEILVEISNGDCTPYSPAYFEAYEVNPTGVITELCYDDSTVISPGDSVILAFWIRPDEPGTHQIWFGDVQDDGTGNWNPLLEIYAVGSGGGIIQPQISSSSGSSNRGVIACGTESGQQSAPSNTGTVTTSAPVNAPVSAPGPVDCNMIFPDTADPADYGC